MEPSESATATRAQIINGTDPFTLESVDRAAHPFRIAARCDDCTRQRRYYAVSAPAFADYIRATGIARCPYTRRELTEHEVLRLDRQLQLPLLRSCWFAISSGDAQRRAGRTAAAADAMMCIVIFARELVEANVPFAMAFLALRDIVMRECRRHGAQTVSRALLLIILTPDAGWDPMSSLIHQRLMRRMRDVATDYQRRHRRRRVAAR